MTVKSKIEAINSSPELLAVNRLILPAAGTLATAFGGVCIWLGLQIWNGQSDIAADVVDLKIQQAVTASKVEEINKRLDRRDTRQGSINP